ncbi:MAG: hypothetical protein U9N38_03810, partial [Thermodesulfobacteriota bacterium]|nr:hypothetical protein [Thermodesulfobacteriota bacterium]
QALDGNGEGMSYIKQIITDGQNFMKPGAWMLIEMAPEQTEAALDLVEQAKGYVESARIKDYSHLYRVIVAQKVESSL